MSKVKKMTVRLMLVVLTVTMLLTGCGKKKADNPSGEGTATQPDKKKELTVVRIGTNDEKGLNPFYKDPVTGESPMLPMRYEAAMKAYEECKKQLNVEVKYVQYQGASKEILLKSVLSNDPLCDIAKLNGDGAEIGQNILQRLDDYVDLFKDPEYSWILGPKLYGHYFLLNQETDFIRGYPLVYNISYIEKVDALKENGKVPMPCELWKQGKWTWSVFEDYLTKINTYYANKKAPVRQDVNIVPYLTYTIYPSLSAIKSNGGGVYADKGMMVDEKSTLEGVKYVDDLVAKKLIVGGTRWNRKSTFKDGESVFTNLAIWEQADAADGLGKRGESMGIVPFPRPDSIPQDDPRYGQMVFFPGDSGIMKGISKEMTDLAVKTFRLYYYEEYKGRKDIESISEYFDGTEKLKNFAALQGFDVTNETYGNDMVDAIKGLNPTFKATDYYASTPWGLEWDKVVNDSILGLNGSPKYETAIAAHKNEYTQLNNDLQAILSSTKIVDNIPPTITPVANGFVYPKGTTPDKIKWSDYIKATDNIDGDIAIENVKIDTSAIKFDTVGFYNNGLVASVKDKEGNEKQAMFGVCVYDPENKEAPVMEAKEGYRSVKLNEDVSKINWGKDFVKSAQSADGFNIAANVTADVSTLDVTTAGKYDVTLTATDYNGNKCELKIPVTVAGK